jgi:hypothetical protein
MRLRIAKMVGIARLYHYQRFKPDRLWMTVLENKVHCAGPRDFNDPWDCRPCYDESVLDDPAVYNEHVEYFDRVDRKHGPPKTDEERAQRLERLRTDPAFLKSLVRVMVGIDKPIHERYRILCLSSKPDSIVMWSHYADKHRGVCLQFSADEEEFSGAYRVEYSETYPSFKLADESLERKLLPLVTKSTAWSYEDEYRVIAEEHALALSAKSLHTHDGFLTIPLASLTSIILGCEMDGAARESVREIVRRSGRAVALKQAVRVPNRYSLSVTDLPSGCERQDSAADVVGARS